MVQHDVQTAPPRSRLTRDDWVGAGLEALGRDGPAGLRIDRLCALLRVTKGSFYWHFPDRGAFLAALLEGWEEAATAAVIARIEARGGDPRDRLAALLEAEIDADAELAIRHWARHERTVRAAVLRVDARRFDYMTALLSEAGFSGPEASARASLVYGLILGEPLTFRREERSARRARLVAALAVALGA